MIEKNLESSIFNTYEERQKTPLELRWQQSLRPIRLSKNEFLYEGELQTLDAKFMVPIIKTYILSFTKLINHIGKTKDGLINSAAILPLRNPRLKKSLNSSLKLYI